MYDSINDETGQRDCTDLRMYDPEQAKVYHPRQADVKLSGCSTLRTCNPRASYAGADNLAQ